MTLRWKPAFWLVAGGVVLVDQLTKQWALTTLVPYENHPVIGDLLSIQLVFNSGAAFSLGNDSTWLLTVIAVVVTVAIVFYGRRARSPLAIAIFGAALGGAIGNLIDRLFRDPSFGQGHVVDMINYGHQFVGNVADIAIVGAGIALVVTSFTGTPILAPEEGDDAVVEGADAPEDGAADQEPAAPADGTAAQDGADAPEQRG